MITGDLKHWFSAQVDSSAEVMARALEISRHLVVPTVRLAEPPLKAGGALFKMSYCGAEEDVPSYEILGPMKSTLEVTARHLAAEFDQGSIRVHAVSTGLIKTRTASGTAEFEILLDESTTHAPAHRLVTIFDVGDVTALLCSAVERAMASNVVFVDRGYYALD